MVKTKPFFAEVRQQSPKQMVITIPLKKGLKEGDSVIVKKVDEEDMRLILK